MIRKWRVLHLKIATGGNTDVKQGTRNTTTTNVKSKNVSVSIHLERAKHPICTHGHRYWQKDYWSVWKHLLRYWFNLQECAENRTDIWLGEGEGLDAAVFLLFPCPWLWGEGVGEEMRCSFPLQRLVVYCSFFLISVELVFQVKETIKRKNGCS